MSTNTTVSSWRHTIALVQVQYPDCHSTDVVQYGKQANGTQHYHCHNRDCPRTIVLLQYQDTGRLPAVSGGGAYRRHLDPSTHTVRKQLTQKIERKHLTFWTCLKYLTRKTICFLCSILTYDLVIFLSISNYDFVYTIINYIKGDQVKVG